MAGTREGGLKAARTNLSQYGPDFYALIGAKGGSKRNIAKGFAVWPTAKHRAASSKGGRTSRKPKSW